MRNTLYRIILLISAFTFIISIGISQTKDNESHIRSTKLFKRAMQLADKGNYEDAIDIFKIITIQNPKDLDALFNMGLCYLNTTNGADSALIQFNKGLEILTDEEREGHIGTEFGISIAKAYQVLLKPMKAIAVYEELIDHLAADDTLLMKEIEHEIQSCHNAHFFMQHPIELTVKNMGSSVNSMYDDHSPLIAVSENKLFFTSRRNWINMSLLPDGQYAEKIYTVPLSGNDWESARLLKVFFKQNEHEAAASLSPDGNEMILFRNDEHGKSLYISHFNGKSWTIPEKLPAPINSYSQETHGSISADKSTLFFTSDRPGGLGGLDIYMVKKDKLGNWGTPKNLGPEINTQYDEETPMIHYDGKTLYFSSEGHNSMGRLDVFYCQMNNDSTWSRPVNLGYPINTPDDDFFFVPTIDKSHAYYASSKFEDNYGGSDIYEVRFNSDSDTELAVIEGTVDHPFGSKMEEMCILVTRRKDNKLVGDYRPSQEDGKYMMFLEIGYEYEVKETNSKDEEKLSYVNVTTEMNYQQLMKPVVFNTVAMDAPLKQIKYTENIIEKTEDVSFKNEDPKKIDLAEHSTTTIHTTAKTTDLNIPKNKTYPQIGSTNFPKGYTIQLLALKKKPLKDLEYFTDKGLNNVIEVHCIDGYTRYTIGKFDGYKSSLKVKRVLIKEGKFKDIWIRPIRDIEDLKVK